MLSQSFILGIILFFVGLVVIVCSSVLSGDRQLLAELRTWVSLGSINREPPNGVHATERPATVPETGVPGSSCAHTSLAGRSPGKMVLSKAAATRSS